MTVAALIAALVDVLPHAAGATSYAALFGPLTGTTAEQQKALRGRFAEMVLRYHLHPDTDPHDAARAASAFHAINTLRREAEVAIDAGTYDAPFAAGPVASSAEIELRSRHHAYRLASRPFRVGDLSMLYAGRIVGSGNGRAHDVLVKVAAVPARNPWLDREATMLRRLGNTRIKQYVPTLLDAFAIRGPGGKHFRANAWHRTPGLVSVADLMTAFPGGSMDLRDSAWVCRRIMAQALAATMVGVVHGAILPPHVLVDPISHEPQHIGWAHAVEYGDPVTHTITPWRDYYPPEMLAGKAQSRSDIYMAGKTMIALLGGGVRSNELPFALPKALSEVIWRCVEPDVEKRWENGRRALDEITRVIRHLWGRAYRPLLVPGL